MVNGRWLMQDHQLLTLKEAELVSQAAEYAHRIDTFLIEREQSVLSKLIAIGGATEEESFEVQAKVRIPNAANCTGGFEKVRSRSAAHAPLQ